MSRHETSSSKVNGNFEKAVKDSEKEWERKCLEFHDFVSWQRNRDETRLLERQEAELAQIILRHEAEMGQLSARWDSCFEKLSKVEKFSLDAVPRWAEILRSSFPHENTVDTSDNPRVEGNQLASRQNMSTPERPPLDSPPASGASGLPTPPSSSATSPGAASGANPLNTNKLPAAAAAADKEQSVNVEPLPLKDNDSDLSSLRSLTPEEPPALRSVRIQELVPNEAVFQSKLLKPSGIFYVLRCHECRGKLFSLFGKTSILPFKDHLRKCRPALGRFRSDQKVLLVYGTKIADADVEWYEQRERTLYPCSSPHGNASKATVDVAITGRGSGDRNHVGSGKCKDARHTGLSQTVGNDEDSSTSSEIEETDESDASDVSNEDSMSQEDEEDWEDYEDYEDWEDEEHPKDDDPEDVTYEDEGEDEDEDDEQEASDDSDGAEEPGPSPNILLKSYAKGPRV
jgi:hypothetical protein